MTDSKQAKPLFVGREKELAILREGLEQAVAGHGQLFLLAGEAGIGKTRIVDELSHYAAARGVAIAWARCWHGTEAFPYWPWIQILRALKPDSQASELTELVRSLASTRDLAPLAPDIVLDTHSSLSDGVQARFRLFDSIASLLVNLANTHPILILFDDLQGSDEASLLLLALLVRELKATSIQIVGTYRPAEVRQASRLSRLLNDLSRDGDLIQLHGLAEVDITRLVEHFRGAGVSSRLASQLRDATDGNPLFIEAILRVQPMVDNLDDDSHFLALSISEGALGLIHQWIEMLSAPAVSIISIAAAIGQEFSVDILALVSEVDADRLIDLLIECQSVGIVLRSAVRNHFQFRHGLIRAALYNHMSASAQSSLHRRIAEAIERTYGEHSTLHLAELAYHFAVAEEDNIAKAIEYAVEAGQQAMGQFAYEAAVRLFEMGLRGVERQGPLAKLRRCELLLLLGRAQTMAGLSPQSNESFKQAAVIADELKAADVLARAALGYRAVLWYPESGFVDRFLVSLLEKALESIGPADSEFRSSLLARLAAELVYESQAFDRVESFSQQAVDIADRMGNLRALTYALWARSFVLAGSRNTQERLALATRLMQLGQQTGDPNAEYTGRRWRIVALFEMGHIQAMDVEIQVCAQLSDQLKRPAYQWRTSVVRTARALLDGRYDDATRLASETVAIGQTLQQVSLPTVFFGLQTSMIYEERGRLEELLDYTRSSVERLPGSLSWRSALAKMYAALDRKAEARMEYERLAVQRFTDLPKDITWFFTVAWLCDVCAFLQDTPRALLLYDLLLPYGDHSVTLDDALSYGSAWRYLGILATTLGNWEEAEAHFEKALKANVAMGARPWIAHTQYAYAKMLCLKGQRAELGNATGLIESALITASELGMSGLESKLQDLVKFVNESQTTTEGEKGPTRSQQSRDMFRREGDYWTICFEGRRFHLKDLKGLTYIAFLLGSPEREFHAFELLRAPLGDLGLEFPQAASVEGCAPTVRSRSPDTRFLSAISGDAGEALDSKAKLAYRRRLEELESELAQAKQSGDIPKAVELEEEYDTLTRELARAIGLGGRDRRMGSVAERARLNVTRAIRAAIEKIMQRQPDLGRFLSNAIRTGTFCSYRPPTESRDSWEL